MTASAATVKFIGQLRHHGVELWVEDGTRLRYRMNGRWSLLITAAAFGAGVGSGLISMRWIYDQFGELISVITLFSYLFAFFLLMPYYTAIDKTKPVPERVVYHD